MSKIIIANSGAASWGKSTTLNMVYDAIVKKYKPNIKLLSNTIDSKAIFTIKIENKIFKIGIETQGDPNSRQEESLKEFLKAKCQIIIVACRSYGKTVENIVKCEKEDYTIIWTKNPYVADDTLIDLINKKYVSHIMSILKEFLI